MSVKAELHLTENGERLFAQLAQLGKLGIKVGFQDDDMHGDGGLTVAEVAAYNEYGTSTSPSRPFMVNAFQNHNKEISEAAERYVKAFTESPQDAEQLLKQMGQIEVGIIQEEITDGEYAPNAPYTIAKKGSSHPLIDTGQMRQSVRAVISEREGG